MKRYFVTKAENYGAITAGGAKELATTPDTLAPGSIGVFAIVASTNKLTFVTEAAADSALYVDGEVVIALGTTTGGPVVSQPLGASSILSGFPSATAPVASTSQVSTVGYNGTAGSLATPTIVDGDWAEIKLIRADNGITQSQDKQTYEVSNMAAGATDYTIAQGFVARAKSLGADNRMTNAYVKITDDLGAGTAFTSGDLAAVNGATTLTHGAAHGVGVADYVRLDGDYYQAITGTVSATLVLDRAYEGPTQTILNAACLDLSSSAAGDVGVEFTAKDPTIVFKVAVSGVLEDATITQVTGGLVGAGDGQYDVIPKENLGRAYLGFNDQI